MSTQKFQINLQVHMIWIFPGHIFSSMFCHHGIRSKETILRKFKENSRCWRFLADSIIIFDYAQEADRIIIYRQTWFYTSHFQNSSLKFVSEMNNINNFYILVPPFKNLHSINRFWEKGEVFFNFSTFCWYLDFLSIVSLISIGLAFLFCPTNKH